MLPACTPIMSDASFQENTSSFSLGAKIILELEVPQRRELLRSQRHCWAVSSHPDGFCPGSGCAGCVHVRVCLGACECGHTLSCLVKLPRRIPGSCGLICDSGLCPLSSRAQSSRTGPGRPERTHSGPSAPGARSPHPTPGSPASLCSVDSSGAPAARTGT